MILTNHNNIYRTQHILGEKQKKQQKKSSSDLLACYLRGICSWGNERRGLRKTHPLKIKAQLLINAIHALVSQWPTMIVQLFTSWG